MATEKTASLKSLLLMGEENLPAGGGFLILPGRMDLTGVLRLEQLLAGRRILYLVEEGGALSAPLRAHLEQPQVHALAISPECTDAASFRRALAAEIGEDTVAVFLPAEATSLGAPLTTVPGVRLDFLIKSGFPVLPACLLHWREVMPDIGPQPTAEAGLLAFGRFIPEEELSLSTYQESLFELSEACFNRHPLLGLSLGYALLLGFKRHGRSNLMVDGKDEKTFSYEMVLAMAIALSKAIRAETQKQRVGIVLPPGLGGLVANVAVVLAGKIPVNLNYTAGRASVDHAIKASGIDKLITADIVVRKMQAFPWPPTRQLMLIERLLPTLKTRIGLWLALTRALPAPLLAAVLGVPRKGGDQEALLLFTSGSSGNPKGVVLSHRNLLANVIQFGSRLSLGRGDSILGCLPLFHSFGCTVTLWYPIIAGLDLITYPSPLETKKLAELVEKHRITLLIATPTFLRGWLRGVPREALASLKLVVTGAEKLPPSVSEAFEQRFGKRVYEGYGLTETSPVSNINLPDPPPLGEERSGHAWLASHRPGSVGQLLPGLAVRITEPESGRRQPLHETGMIWFRGANVFPGYHEDPKRSAEVIDAEGWFRTGDLGRVDMDGFLHIEGRLSRFSKIGGEMVPHETVEEALIKALGLENESYRRLAVVGVPDPDKGEALVLLSSLPGGPEAQEIIELRYRLLDKGLPALWIPKRLIRVEDIPILSSGKLDVQACERMARGGA